MRAWMLLITMSLVTFAFVSPAKGATSKKKAKATTTAATKSKVAKAKANGLMDSGGELKTNINFGDSYLRGEYMAPEEALVKVEKEKGLADLIGVRKHFKDRLSVAAEQE